MIKILFICHGNICRSPAAEMILRGMTDRAEIDSMATSSEELGNGLYPPMRQAMLRRGITLSPHTARQTKRADYARYDYIIGMDRENMWEMKRIYGGDPDGKLSLLLEWAGERREVSDPWYTRDFDQALDDIERGCREINEKLAL